VSFLETVGVASLVCMVGSMSLLGLLLFAHLWSVAKVRRELDRNTLPPGAALAVKPEPVAAPESAAWPEWVGDEPTALDADERVAALVQVGAAWVHRACRDNRTRGFPEWICGDCAPVLVTAQRKDRDRT